MNSRGRHQAKRLALATALLVASLSASVAFGDTAIWSARPEGLRVSGSTVFVTVSNPSSTPVSGTVAVKTLLVNGTSAWGYASYSLNAGQSAAIAVRFSSPVQSITTLGMSDDANPFGL